MRMFRLFKRDFKEGILKNIRLLSVPILIWIICSLFTDAISECQISGQASFADYCLYCFAGIDPICFTKYFVLPVLWLSVFIFSCYATFDFVQRDISSVGQQTILRVGNRENWWICKCGWVICTTVIYYGLVLLTILVYCLFHQVNISMHCSQEFTYITASSGYFTVNDSVELGLGQTIKCIILLPITVLLALNMLQLVLSLVFKSIAGFIIISTYILLSTYWMSPALIGSFGMIKNSNAFVQGGFDVNDALIECLVIIFVSIVIGTFVFNRYSILQDRGDE